METALTATGPEILKTSEAFLATMDLRALLLGRRRPQDIAASEVEAIYQRHGLHGATRQALANHLYAGVLRQTGALRQGQVDEATALTLDRVRVLLGAA